MKNLMFVDTKDEAAMVERLFDEIRKTLDEGKNYKKARCFDEAAYVDYMLIRLQPGVIEYHVPEEVMNVVELTPSYGNTFSPMMAWDVGPGELNVMHY